MSILDMKFYSWVYTRIWKLFPSKLLGHLLETLFGKQAHGANPGSSVFLQTVSTEKLQEASHCLVD